MGARGRGSGYARPPPRREKKSAQEVEVFVTECPECRPGERRWVRGGFLVPGWVAIRSVLIPPLLQAAATTTTCMGLSAQPSG